MKPAANTKPYAPKLSREIEQGLAEVERDGDSVIIRLGQQGQRLWQRGLQPSFTETLISVGNAVNNTGGLVRSRRAYGQYPRCIQRTFSFEDRIYLPRGLHPVANFLLDNSQLQPGQVTILA